MPLCQWVAQAAEAHRRKLMVRLVKGAYWDTEVKAAQVAGLPDYPVFTRKVATDVSYLACAKALLDAGDVSTLPSPRTMRTRWARSKRWPRAGHSNSSGCMAWARRCTTSWRGSRAIGDERTPVRIYAPVGSYKDLLAYLVRRLLENGANSSFVNRIADEQVSLDELVGDPVAELEALEPKRNPKIALPCDLFGAERRNSAGVDLSDPLVREPLLDRLKALESRSWTAKPTLGKGEGRAVISPHDRRLRSARCSRRAPRTSTKWSVPAMPHRSDGMRSAAKRARELLDRTADLYEEHREEFFSLCIREAGKTLIDAILEVREAVDFLRFYAAEARRQFTRPMPLPGPTGEQNELRLHGRGVFASISPWNFPLAIFTGLSSAPLAAGNAVIAKPAGQTPLIGALAVELMHQAGIPKDVVQLAPGSGRVVGGTLTAHPLLAGVVFTGSTETARMINRTLAEREGRSSPSSPRPAARMR